MGNIGGMGQMRLEETMMCRVFDLDQPMSSTSGTWPVVDGVRLLIFRKFAHAGLGQIIESDDHPLATRNHMQVVAPLASPPVSSSFSFSSFIFNQKTHYARMYVLSQSGRNIRPGLPIFFSYLTLSQRL